MDRIRDGRRGGVSVGGGPPPPPRRRLRSNGGGGGGSGAGPRDSPRSERRRGDRLMLNGGGGGAGRDDGDDTSDESLGDDDDDAEEELAPRYQQQRRSPSTAPPPPSPPQPGGGHHHSSSSSGGGGYHNHHHHHGQQLQRKGGGSNPKSPIVVKAVDEMIGVPVPRKARSASTKRSSHEWPVPGGGTSGGSAGAGEGSQIQRPSSRPISPASASTTAPVRKKLKPLGGGGGSSGGSGPAPKQRPSPSPSPAPSTAPLQPPAPKISKSPSFIQEEIEVAEVLFGLTRQFPCPPPKQESNHKLEPRDAPEAKSGNSSPAPSSSGVRPSDSTSLSTIAPKRKRPRLVKYDEDSRPASPAKPELAEPSSRSEAPPVARSEAKTSTSAAAESGASAAPAAAAAQLETSREPDKTEEHGRSRDSELRPSESDRRDHRLESLAEPPAPAPSGKPDAEATPVASEARNGEATATTKIELASDGSRQEKFCIDLMAPPPGKLSPDRDGSSDPDADKKGLDSQMDMLGRGILEKKDGDRTRRGLDIDLEDHKVQRIPADELAPKKLTLQLDLEKPSLGDEKSPSERRQPQPPPQQQQQKPSKSEIKHEKSAMPAVTPPMPIPVGGWLGSFPPFGYLPVPGLSAAGLHHPMDVKPGSSSGLQHPALLPPPTRSKRCAMHCYIAQFIQHQQRVAKMNSFWPPTANRSGPFFGPRPFNMGVVPPTDAASLLVNPMQGSYPVRAHTPMQEAKAPSVAASPFQASLSKDKSLGNAAGAESSQRKQPPAHETQQSTPMPNMLQTPAFIFPFNQQQAAAVAAANAANRAGDAKSSAASNAMPPSANAHTSAANPGAAAMNLSFANLQPADAQFLAILQNGAYPFQVAAHAGGPPSYRGMPPPGGPAVPFFNGHVYSPHMMHPSQQQGAQQQSHQKTPMPTLSSSSQKHQQQSPGLLGYAPTAAATAASNSQNYSSGNQRPVLLPGLTHRQEGDKAGQDGPSSDDKPSHSQKGGYEHSFAVPVNLPNFAMMPTAQAAGSQSDKKSSDHHHHQQQQTQVSRGQGLRIDLASSQPFVMPFGSIGPPGSAPTGLDFSALAAQNHAVFHHQEAARHGYPQLNFAAAQSVQATQHKPQHQMTGETKSVAGDSSSTPSTGDSERKKSASTKYPGDSQQHSLSFTRTENKSYVAPFLGGSTNEGSSRTLSLIGTEPPNAFGMGSKSTNSSTPASTPAAASSTISQQQHQQQQHFLQMHPKHQQQLIQHHHLNRPRSAAPSTPNSAGGYPDRLSFQNMYPSSAAQGGVQSPQLKASSGRGAPSSAATTPSAAPPSNLIMMKNSSHHQQQAKVPMQALSTPGHQPQSSLTMSTSKMGPSNLSTGGDLSRSSNAPVASGSPSNSVSKSTGGSPPATGSAKIVQQPVQLQSPQQQSAKNPASTSGSKSIPTNHFSMPSILGQQPNVSPGSTPGSKQQSHMQKHQPYPQGHFFISSNYGATQALGASAAPPGLYQKRPGDKSQQQAPHQQNAMSAAASNNMKVLHPSSGGFMHLAAAAQSAGGVPHSHMSAAQLTFGVGAMPMPVKPSSDQKPAAGK